MHELTEQGLSSGTLVLAAHPDWRDSRVYRRRVEAAQAAAGRARRREEAQIRSRGRENP